MKSLRKELEQASKKVQKLDKDLKKHTKLPNKLSSGL